MMVAHGGGPGSGGGTSTSRAVSRVRPESSPRPKTTMPSAHPGPHRGVERARPAQPQTADQPTPGRSLGQLPLVRRVLGDVLRRTRLRQDRTLRQVSAAAMVSLGYLSEVERGQKEASSELLAAICSALDVPQSAVLREVSEDLAAVESVPSISGAVRGPGAVVAAA